MRKRKQEAADHRERIAWHALPIQEIFGRLESGEKGLTEAEAARRLEEHGPNTLPLQRPPPLWKVVQHQFMSPLIYILGIAGVVSLGIGEVRDASFIFGVLVLNAIIGTYQEWKAEQSTFALQKLLQIFASVQRQGEVREIKADDVVPGDVVWLESGYRAPADVRLVTAHGLDVDESLLTGESLPVSKDPSWMGEASTPLGDRQNMVFAGSIMTRGRGKGVVVATGTSTSVGQLAMDVLTGAAGKAPLLVRMERFTNVIAVVILVSAALIGILGVAIGPYTMNEMFMFAVALAVSAIPEGLPVGLTIALAVATTRMTRRGVIVRRLTAVEGLGSCTYIGTDKTGTLTCNELTVTEVQLASGEIFQVTGEGFAPEGEVLFEDQPVERGTHPVFEALARSGVLCNEADLHQRDGNWVWRGDSVDVALLTLGHKVGSRRDVTLDDYPQVNQIPFEPEHQYAATFHEKDGAVMVFVKGAPERVLTMCAGTSGSQSLEGLDDVAIEMASRGFRVLGLAEGKIEGTLGPGDQPPEPSNLTFHGFVGMIDPLRPGVREAVQACHEAGVTVVMITGDHRVTALAIARDLDLAHEESQVITGAELAAEKEADLGALVERVRVFARVAPRQKLEIVEAAQKAGHFVAVTGDGVNDAPALQAANIGVAMGKEGTDVAREASELVISDDNFASVVNGIEEGRVAYDNIRKVIFLLVSTGAAELILMGLAILSGTPLPLLPVQILWLNLATNGIQHVALAFEPNEGDVLKRKPRPPQEPIFNWLMIERTVVAALAMGTVAFLAFRWLLPENATDAEVSSARNALLLLMVLFENVHIGNCRSETKSAFSLSPLRSPFLLAAAISAFLLHLGAMYAPIGHTFLGTAPLPLETWSALIGMALVILPVMELHKWTWRLRHPEH